MVTGLLPGIYSVASTDENLELAHSVVEVRAGEVARVHINLQPWEYTAGAYDPYAYNTYYGTYGPGVYPAYPYGAYSVSPYEPYGTADAGAIAVEAPSQEIDYVVTGPNGYSRDFEGDFVLDTLWPGVYVIAATETGYDLAVTTVEVRAEELLPVTPVLVELEANPGEGQEQQDQQTQAAEEQTVPVSLIDFDIKMPQSIRAGSVTFEVTNAGSVKHNFEIEGQGIEEEFKSNLQPGETETMTVNLQPGT